MIQSSVDSPGIRLGYDKSIDLIDYDLTLDQPCQHLSLLTRTCWNINEPQIDKGSDV